MSYDERAARLEWSTRRGYSRDVSTLTFDTVENALAYAEDSLMGHNPHWVMLYVSGEAPRLLFRS